MGEGTGDRVEMTPVGTMGEEIVEGLTTILSSMCGKTRAEEDSGKEYAVRPVTCSL